MNIKDDKIQQPSTRWGTTTSPIIVLVVTGIAVCSAVVGAIVAITLGGKDGKTTVARNSSMRSFKPVLPKGITVKDFQTQMDKDALKTLSNLDSAWVDRNILKPFLDDINTLGLCMGGVEIAEGQFPDRPDLHRIIEDCARILDIKKPRVFLSEGIGHNAMTMNAADPIIILSTTLLNPYYGGFSEQELYFIIGHEMGHIKCAHVKWLTMFYFGHNLMPEWLAKILLLPLFKWQREGEGSCDNAGLLCCQDIDVAERALMRLHLGLADAVIGHIDVDTFLEQRESEEFSTLAEVSLLLKQIGQTHPFTANRIRQLRTYSSSKQYKEALAKFDQH